MFDGELVRNKVSFYIQGPSGMGVGIPVFFL